MYTYRYEQIRIDQRTPFSHLLSIPALGDRLRVLGANHPGTVASRNNLAAAYESAGDLGRAIPLFEQAPC